jgi:hypothetical protein
VNQAIKQFPEPAREPSIIVSDNDHHEVAPEAPPRQPTQRLPPQRDPRLEGPQQRQDPQQQDPQDVYRRATRALSEAKVPFLVGGGHALAQYTPLGRLSKDFDVFLRPEHVRWAFTALMQEGFEVSLPYPHWLGKAFIGKVFIDLIFSSGNGVALVDDEWFAHAMQADVLGQTLQVCPAEEVIWSKAFVCERERFDGADVLHMIRDCGHTLDWQRVLRRFGPNWRVLLAHLVMFGFAYPGERDRVPAWVMDVLTTYLAADREPEAGAAGVCRGTLLSREQYLVDLESLGYIDGRVLSPEVHMSLEDINNWTRAIPGRNQPDEQSSGSGGR